MSSPSPHSDHEEKEEKDSLFSSEEEEAKTVTTVHTEEDVVEKFVEYPEEELERLVSYVKSITMLQNLKPTDWTEECDDTIRTWFTDTSLPVLIVFKTLNNDLKCQTGAPEGPIVDLTYFMREQNQRFEANTFHDNVFFGTLNQNIEGCILAIIRDVYGALVRDIDNWPDSVRNEFNNNLQIFLAKFTDLHYKLYGLTILYLPQEVLNIPVNVASKDKELVKRLEGMVVYWTKQVRVGLQDQEQSAPDELLRPQDEYEFWENRHENLVCLDFQLENKCLKHICNILSAVQSVYVRQFRSLADEITKNIQESISNLRYLNVLLGPCEELAQTTRPEEFPEKIPKILHLIRFIWLNSPHFNTKEKITQLCKSLSNQLILQCKKYIDLDVVFVEKRTRKAIKMFETCIDCMTEYIRIYVRVSMSQNKFSDKPWDLDKAPIFNHVDSFIKRCRDMIEVCEAMIVFGRYDESETVPTPGFIGSKGEEFELWAERILKMFNDSLEEIEKVKSEIFDVQKATWFDDILKFKSSLKDIEVVVENLTNAVFDNVANVEEGIHSLASLYIFSKRNSLLSLFEGKVLEVYKMFRQEILDTKSDMQQQSEYYPALMPYYAGRAHMIEMRTDRLRTLKQMFDDAKWLLPCGIAKEIFAQYEKLVGSTKDAQLDLFRKWVDSIGEDVNARVNRPILCKSVANPGLLECNIDRSLLDIFHEVKYWDSINYEVPAYLKNICTRSETIKFMYECVLNIVLDYNRIVTSLSDDERLLFKPLIMTVEKKISPGLSSLTWATDIGDEYIMECSNHTAELQNFLDDYKSSNLQMVAICEKICDMPLITLKPNYAYDIIELVNEIAKSVDRGIDTIIDMYAKIVQYIVLVFEGFEYHMGTMAGQWVKYVNNFDKLIEEALKISCKNALTFMYETLHGDDTTVPTPVIKLSTNLIDNKIKFIPTLVEVALVLSNIHSCLVEAIKTLPRLGEKFLAIENEVDKPYSEILMQDEGCRHLQHLINEEMRLNMEYIREYMSGWEPFRNLWEVDKERFITSYEMENPTAMMFDSNIARYSELANQVQGQETVSAVKFLQIECQELKQALINHCTEWQESLYALLLKMTEDKLRELYHYIESNKTEIMKEPETLVDMQNALQLFDQLKEDIPFREGEFPFIHDDILILDKYSVPIPQNTRNMEKNIPKEWANYLDVLDQVEKMLEYSKVLVRDMKEEEKTQLLEEAKSARIQAEDMLDNFMKTGPFTSEWSATDALSYLGDVKEKLKALMLKTEQLNDDLGIFGLSFPESVAISKLEMELTALEMIWGLVHEWDEAWKKYKTGEFWIIETTEMEETAQTLFRKFTRLSKEYKDKGWTIIDETRKAVDAFRRTLPLIVDLKNPAMRPRHWTKVKKAVGVDFNENASEFNLAAIFSMEFHKYGEEINEISNAATMELAIEDGIKSISEIWAHMKLDMVPYKERMIYKIKSVDEMFQTLDENMSQLSKMKSTKFVEPFAKEVEKWERMLSFIMECVEMALQVQRQFLYLENIFFGEDIRKQLPKESDDFDLLTDMWRVITVRLYFSKTAYKAVTYKPPPYLLQKLTTMNDRFELLQRALERYLETKRHVFPRFYFISNDDLLEILGNSKKPELVQTHLKKLFDNITKIKMQKNLGLNKTEIAGMMSDDGEYVEFVKPFFVEGPSEAWLVQLEAAMRTTLRAAFKPCRSELKKMLNKRDKWLMGNYGQLCNACSLIQWTTDCTRAMVHSKIMESKKPLKRLRKKQTQVLSKLSDLSRKDLTKLQRLKTNALITIEIHSRDVIDRLYKANCRDINAFEWFSQLRFYWDRDVDDCVIRQTNTCFNYGYEYNGNSGRLVITPLTDRCYITLTTALHLYRGGSPKGPAGTGKTETVKDLGKAMGMWVIVNNCSEGLDYKSMGKCFSGLAQTGAWGCFDEFNRINIEVLSVVAQQILCILQAVSQKQKRFVFEGIEIELKLSVGIFITMNPGYAGRTELPDNLKSMFRPISMMVPDSGIIAENILFSDGFSNTKVLAKKVFTLYRLAVQQLSKQDHYDFGLRSMVALLRYAGKKRRQMPMTSEDEVVYLAMRDMNVARLTSDDLPLFNGIMSDIFPGVRIPVVNYADINIAVTEFMEENNWQPIPIAMTKVIQLYETKSSRHSVMILGKTCTAKSVTWKTLQGAMGKLKAAEKPGFNVVHVYPLNPKSLNLGELYGEYNLSTNEWLDGVISAVMRTICQEETPDEKWIVFDGPVDAVWIENMNSVMDDNKVLTLINSDRITMPEQVSLLFEVGDLAVASPATVSRCGMVYNDYKDWGWRPYVKSWIASKAKLGQAFVEKMTDLFESYLPTLLEFKRLNCEEIAVCPELNLVMSFCKLLEIFLTKEYGLNPADEDRFEDITKNWFLFSLIWSVCATCDEEGRKKLDVFIREKEGIFPIKDTIYEYFFEFQTNTFQPWEERLQYDWKYEPGCPFYKINVPTIDTVRYKFIVKHLLLNGCPVLLTGPVGTGKTSLAQAALNDFGADNYLLLYINLSAQTSSNNLQELIESRLEKRTKSNFAPIGGRKMITFLDDLNMPVKEVFGAQPPLELLRQWLGYGFWYDRQKQLRKYVENMNILAAMGPPGGGRNIITDRLLSLFNVINMTFPDNTTIARIYGTMLAQHLSEFDEGVKLVGKVLTETTISLYKNVVAKMLPTPTKIHYLFNLRDISKIFQGLLRSHKDYQNDKATLLKLWIHECYRVFCDRLTDENDIEWFAEEINTELGRYFELTLHSLCPGREIPIYADFVNPWNIYEEHSNIAVLKTYLDQQLEEYNVSPGVVRMNLVLFKDAIKHICRIVRVISQPRGNMLLVGIGGSGRTALTRIASYICEFNVFQVNIRKNYLVPEFKEDLKSLYYLSGVNGKLTTFLFNDNQVTDEQFLEILNNMLSSGEVTNLFKPDEFEELKSKIEPAATKAKITPTNEAIYEFLIMRVRANMHMVICMSPIGEAFRNRLRQYPALINCTTIDWFREWPKEALLEVANRFVGDVDFAKTITGEKSATRRESLILTTQDRMRQAVSEMFASIHESVENYSRKMFIEMKRVNYVTPTNYLELVAGYKKMLSSKRLEVSSRANILRNGLYKIDDCKAKVTTMSVELEEAQIKVAEYQQECEVFLARIQGQRKEADEQQKEVTKKSIKIGEEEVQCKRMADIAQADLDEAMPALEEAIKALDALSKKDISELKSYGTPPQKVKMVMEAVNILKGIEPTWEAAKRLLGEMNFLKDLKEFDKNHITDKTLKKIATYTMSEEFIPEKVGIVSYAAKSLCLWVIAIEKYARVWKVVGPKKAKLDEALDSLKEKQMMLAEAQAKLAELNKMLQRLQKEYEEKLEQKEELNRKAELLKLKLERAATLVACLSGERERWDETVTTLDGVFEYLPGDCLLATAFVSYMGPFIGNYREDLMAQWQKEATTLDIAFSKDFNVINFLSDPTTVREWNINGLPADNFSTENGIIVTSGDRWPLVIDPQCQAQKWIKAMEEKNKLQVIDLRTPGYMAVLQKAVQFGHPVLLQNVLETIDPSIGPILSKAVVKQGGMDLIKLEDVLISYDYNFKFFITTKLSNPHYSPEISTKTTLVNFALIEQGLEAQLLGIVVRKEKPQLEEEKDRLVTSIAKGKRTLMDLEDELLRLLNETRGSLLEDAELFNTLQVSKATSETVKSSLETAETTEVQIDSAREGYRPCAKRAAILFFVLSDMGRIDPMYQFALDSYILLFVQSIQKSSKSKVLSERIVFLNEYHTFAVYRNTCRALFEHHKLLFSFHMCIKILNAQGKVVPAEYHFLLRGGVVLDRENQIDNPCTAWLTETAWDNLTELDKLQGFHGVVDSFEQYSRDWYNWYIHTEPETLPLIGEWDGICNEFQKMLFVRSLRQDRVAFTINNFIVNQLGPQFVEPPVLNIKSVLAESLPQTPLIFVLSPGVDPTSSLIQLAEAAQMSSKFECISLGQGQAPVATRLLQNGVKEGHWVFLANCHLSLSWMPKLDKIVEKLQTGKVHQKFRLWLSSSPHPLFPISILQAGIKMTTEPPKGLKANLKRLYNLITEEQFNSCQYPEKYKKLLFGLCFFHAILLERKKFQQLGWNVIYSFNDSDFQVSENLLTIYLNEYQVTPWDALKYLIAGVSYGGHVTDDWDRRLLTTYINQYFCDDALNIPYFRLSSLSTYYIPRDGSIQTYLDYITLLPNVDRPEAFGQHPNADITSLISESRSLFQTLMSLQVQSSTGVAESKEAKVSEHASDVLNKLPAKIDYENTLKLIGPNIKVPLNVVLLQEIQRYNTLLDNIKTSLEDLKKGIAGLVVMSTELDEIFQYIYEGRVPPMWLNAYPSLKALGSWTRDLIARIEHFSRWAETTHPPLFFWLAAYTFPTGFLTAVLQTTARATEMPIDVLNWEFTVLTIEEVQIQIPPESGVYVKGMFLEGAGWNKKNAMLIEPQPMQLVCQMPLIHFKPVEQTKKKTKAIYNFNSLESFKLKLTVGDALHLLAEEVDWYYGYVLNNRHVKGIFPKSFVHVKPCKTVDSTGPRPNEAPITQEITQTLREWGVHWKNLYVSHSEHFEQIKNQMYDLILHRSKIISGTLPVDELKRVTKQSAEEIDMGNKILGLDLVVRDSKGDFINPDETSTVQLFYHHKNATERMSNRKKSEIKEVQPKSAIQQYSNIFLVAVRNFTCKMSEDAELLMTLYDGKELKAITESYVVRWTKEGLMSDLDQMYNLRVMFTDLGKKDLERERIFLVCYVIRVGAMDIKETDHRRSSVSTMIKKNSNENMRRPCGVAAFEITSYMNGKLETDLEQEFSVPFVNCEKDNLEQTLRKIITKEKFENKNQALFISMKLLRGDLKQVREENPHLVLGNVAIARKMGFPEVILPGDVRNDLYLTLISGEFTKGNKTSDKNVEVIVHVCNDKCQPIPGVISLGGGVPPINQYRSVIYYHEDKPQWYETFKVAIPIEEFKTSHLKFLFKHRSSNEAKDKSEKPFAMSYVKLMQENGTTLKDAKHNLIVYKIDHRKFDESSLDYFKLPSNCNETKEKFQVPGLTVSTKDSFCISSNICSTKLTQNVDLLGLLNWASHKETLTASLNALMKVDGEEVVKFLQDILDALFNILMDNPKTDTYDTLVFECLLHIIGLVVNDWKYQHFEPVLDLYIKESFSATLAYKKLISVLKSIVNKASDVTTSSKDNLIFKTMKCLQYVMRFVSRSRVLFMALYPEDDPDDDFDESLRDLLQDIIYMMSSRKDSLLREQGACLKYLPSTLPDIMLVFNHKELSTILYDMLNNIPPGRLTKQKMMTINEIVHSKLFLYPESRKILLPIITNQVKVLFETKEEGVLVRQDGRRQNRSVAKVAQLLGTTEQFVNQHVGYPEEVELCIKIMSDLMELLFRTDIGSTYNDLTEIINTDLRTIIQSHIKMERENPHASNLVAVMIDIFRQMTSEHYERYINRFKTNFDILDFLMEILVVFKELVSNSVFPRDWCDMIMLQNSVILKSLRFFSHTIRDCFFAKFEHDAWSNFFHCAIAFMTQDVLQLENFSHNKRTKIVNQYKDMRREMGFEIRSMWFNLGQNKVQFVPSLVGLILEMTLIPEPELRQATIPIFFDMMQCEFYSSKYETESYGDTKRDSSHIKANFSDFENEMIVKLDALFEGGKGDDEYRVMFFDIMMSLCTQHTTMREEGVKFVHVVSRLMESLLEYRSIITDENKESTMSCTVNLLDFYSEINKKEMYIRYLNKLFDLHLECENFTEAAFTLELHTKLLRWSDESLSSLLKGDKYGMAKTHRQLKEALYYTIIENYSRGKMWEFAIKKCQELAEQFEQETFDYERLSDLHKRMSIFYDDIMKKARAEPEYFRVGYYGKGFPPFLQNKAFVYRGKEYERLADFNVRIMNEFPKAELLNKLTPPGDEITQSDKQYLQINKVDPVMDEKKQRFSGKPVAEQIVKFYRVNNIQKFTFSRPFIRKDPYIESSNEFAHLWLERTELTTSYSLPGILRWFPVQSSRVNEISPLRNAIETMEKINKSLTNYVKLFNKDRNMHINPLSLLLNGILDAAVMGGIKNYEEVFFIPEYETHHEEDSILIEKLKDLIADQIPLLDLCVQIHKVRAPENLQPLHKRMEECFAVMKSSVEEKYGKRNCDIKIENEVQIRRHYSVLSDRLSDITITPDSVGGRSRVSSLTRSQVTSLKNFTSNFNFTASSPVVNSRSTNHGQLKGSSPGKSNSHTPSLSHKKSHKTPKEKRRSSKTDLLSPSSDKGGTQWYTSESDGGAATLITNGTTTIFELTQELHPRRPLRSEVEREKRLSRPSSGQFSRPNSMSVTIRGTSSSGTSSNRDSVGTTDSNVSEEDQIPPPLPAKHREVDPSVGNENYSFLYSHRNSHLQNAALQLRLSAEVLEVDDDNGAEEEGEEEEDVPLTPPPKPPKVKHQQYTVT